MHARLGGGAGNLQNVVNGSNIVFLSWYDSTGRLPKATAAGLQSSRITIPTRHYLKKFPHWNLASCQSCNVCSVINAVSHHMFELTVQSL